MNSPVLQQSIVRKRHSVLALTAVLALTVLAVSAASHGLWSPDEPREVEIGREMFVSGLGPVPHLVGEPFLEKPPLFPWAMAVSYAVFGVSVYAARVPAVLASLLSVFAAYGLGRRVGGRAAGLASSCVLLTTAGFLSRSTDAINDTLLTACVAMGHLALLGAGRALRDGRPPFALAGAAACAGLAFMTKGPIGPILIAAPACIAAFATWRDPRSALRFSVGTGCAIVLGVIVIGAPWVLWLWKDAGADAVRECLVNNTLGRALGDTGYGEYGHLKSWTYYISALPSRLLPWVLAWPAALMALRHSADVGAAPEPRRTDSLELFALVLAGAVLLSIPSGKRSVYLMPLLPAAAAFVGIWLAGTTRRAYQGWDRGTLALIHGILVAAGLLGVVAGLFPALAGDSAVRLPGGPAFVASATVFTLLGAATFRATFRGSPSGAVYVVALALAGAVGHFALIVPRTNGALDLMPGARRLASSIPQESPVFGLRTGETLRALLAYADGRFIRDLPTLAAAVDALRAEPGGYLLLDDDRRAERLLPKLEKVCERVATLPLDDSHAVLVYRLRH